MPHELDCFTIKLPTDFHGAMLEDLDNADRFTTARLGDHLCIHIQCRNCQSQNIRGHILERNNVQDEVFKALVIRASLDAFWAQATATVKAHVKEVQFIATYGDALNLDPLPALGPIPLYLHGGMLQAIMLLMRSLEPGQKNSTVQFSTARKTQAALTGFWDVSPVSGSHITLSSLNRGGRLVATLAPSESCWYEKFSRGGRSNGRCGVQDLAYTIEVLLELIVYYVREWRKEDLSISLHVISACMFLMVSCLGRIWGFKVVWTDLAMLKHDLSHCEALEDFSAMSWPIVGRFKGHDGKLSCYMISIAGKTNSGIPFFEWTQRFVRRLELAGRKEGWAFQRKDGNRAKAFDYRDDIYTPG